MGLIKTIKKLFGSNGNNNKKPQIEVPVAPQDESEPTSFVDDQHVTQDTSKTPTIKRESNAFNHSPSTWSWLKKTQVPGQPQTDRRESLASIAFARALFSKTGDRKSRQSTATAATSSNNGASNMTNHTNQTRSGTTNQGSSLACVSTKLRTKTDLPPKPSSTNQRVAFLDTCGYTLERDIDSGAFADVYLAKSKTSKKKRCVAIKRINLCSKQNKKFINKFLGREMFIHARLQHPCIIKFYQSLYDQSDLYMVLEWVPRGNMLDFCRLKGRLNEPLAARVMYQICSGLAYMHLNDICHRDIKCENVLLMSTEPLNIKIADFGFAKCIGPKVAQNPVPGADIEEIAHKEKSVLQRGSDGIFSENNVNQRPLDMIGASNSSRLSKSSKDKDDYLTGTFCGSLAYSAPELVMGKMYDGRKVDSWSAGCILFIMLTHRMAFREKNGNRALVQQQLAGVKWPQSSYDKISQEAKMLVEYILDFNWRERPFTDKILNHHWFAPYRSKIQQDIQGLANEQSGTSLENHARTRRKSMSESAIIQNNY